MKKSGSVNYILKDLLFSYFMWFTILSFAFAACCTKKEVSINDEQIKNKCKLVKIKL